MAYKELEVGELTEIDSVSSFISAVKALKESDDGTSTELYFRGQDAEFWDIEPSIFRNNMLSIEHRLMQIPLQKIPAEFKEFHTTFDIMTKYQHYGMCTRLLDLTTNPLVALYFACKCHGEESYIGDDGEEKHEPYGVIYYTRNYYPSLPTDLEIQIVSALANYDLSKENTVANVLARLKRDHIQFPASRSRSLGFGCRSSSAPTPSGHRLSRPPSHPRHLRIVLPAEERVPALAPRCLQGAHPAPQRSAGYNTTHGGTPSERCAAAGRKRRWGVLLRAVNEHPAGSSRPALCKCRPAAQIAIPYVILPLKISPAGLQCKMYPPFGYSLPKPKGRCECANF